MEALLLILASVAPVQVHSGGLSMYAPGDGFNRGLLACGGRFNREQVHVAVRGWKRLGCGRRVIVCVEHTGRCMLTRVRDAGPFGIANGRGGWRVHTRGAVPEGWHYRAIMDISEGLWRHLGRPRVLTKAHLIVLPTDGEELERALEAVERLLPVRRLPVS